MDNKRLNSFSGIVDKLNGLLRKHGFTIQSVAIPVSGRNGDGSKFIPEITVKVILLEDAHQGGPLDFRSITTPRLSEPSKFYKFIKKLFDKI